MRGSTYQKVSGKPWSKAAAQARGHSGAIFREMNVTGGYKTSTNELQFDVDSEHQYLGQVTNAQLRHLLDLGWEYLALNPSMNLAGMSADDVAKPEVPARVCTTRSAGEPLHFVDVQVYEYRRRW